MKVFVTGADGFIGSHLVQRLIKLGHKVKAFTFYNFRGSNGWLDSIDKKLLKDLHIIWRHPRLWIFRKTNKRL